MIPKINMGRKARELAERDRSTELVGALAGEDVRPNEFADSRSIPVADIRVDREQARMLGITLEMLRSPESVTDPDLRAKVEAILGLAETMKSMGQQNAIEVFVEGGRYTLVSGERRFWAAQYLGLETLHAKVLSEKPQRLRLKQYVENAQREGLSTRETLKALADVVAECERLGEPVESFSELKRQTGLPKATASRWWSVLSGPKEVRDWIAEGRLTSLMAADTIARTEDPARRLQLLAELVSAEEQGGLRDALQSASQKNRNQKPAKGKGGRPTKLRYAFKVSSNKPDVMRIILERLMGQEAARVDYRNPKAVTKALDGWIAALEKENA